MPDHRTTDAQLTTLIGTSAEVSYGTSTNEDTSALGNTGTSHGKGGQLCLHKAYTSLSVLIISTRRVSVHPSYIRLFSYHQSDIKLHKLLHYKNMFHLVLSACQGWCQLLA